MAGSATRWRDRLSRVSPWHVLVLLAAGAVLVQRARHFYPYMADDAFISLRYAHRLIDGQGLTWTDGPRVEGYSNLLWVLACALLGVFGVDLVVAARVLGMGTTLAALIVVAWTYRKRPWLASAASLGTLALAGPIAVWAIGGLEQPMLVLWLALGLCFSFPLIDKPGESPSAARPMLAGLFFGLLALTRVDGLLFGSVVALNILFAGRPRQTRLRTLVRFGLPLFGLVTAQLLFRLAYYHDVIPNTGRAKLAFGPAHMVLGDYYVRSGLLSLRAIFLLAAAASVLSYLRNHKPRTLLLASLLVTWLGYVVFVGGDIFVAWRQFVPAIVLAAFLIAEGVSIAQTDSAARWVAGVVMVSVLLLHLHDQKRDARLAFAESERWEWDGEVVGRFLASAFADKAPLLAVDPGGAIPYYSGLPALDMLGLCDRFLARHPPANFGETLYLGHELGNGPYVLSRKPDLVLFCLPQGAAQPCFRSGRELVQLDGFREGYQLVTFEGERPHRFRSRIWVRREAGRIGIQRSPGRVVIPGFLAGDASTTWSHLDSAGKLVTEIPPNQTVSIDDIALHAGRWKVTAGAEGGTPRARVSIPGAADAEPQALPFEIQVPAENIVAIEVAADTPIRLEYIAVESVAPPTPADK
jgi:arabinofuranosyltransferase